MNKPFIKIYNEDCRDTMLDVPVGQFDLIITSPFYNTNKKQGRNRTLSNTSSKSKKYSYVRYDVHCDSMSDKEYINFSVNLFNDFGEILNQNGAILYNLSYGNENTCGFINVVNAVIEKTDFTLADTIVWKKSNALPNNCSPNKLTRICEFIFVFVRKTEIHTFNCNKPIKSHRRTGQASYGSIYNFIEAKNNDGPCPYNKATYSTDLVSKLLRMYATKGGDTWVYDPFIGSGTTAVACKKMGINCIGSEISAAQVKYAENWLANTETETHGI